MNAKTRLTDFQAELTELCQKHRIRLYGPSSIFFCGEGVVQESAGKWFPPKATVRLDDAVTLAERTGQGVGSILRGLRKGDSRSAKAKWNPAKSV